LWVIPRQTSNMTRLLTITLLTFLFLSCTSQTADKQKAATMSKRYFTEEDFNNKYGKEMVSAVTVYGRMTKNGFKENALATFDFDFTSDKKENLDSLSKFLKDNYDFTLKNPKRQEDHWLLEGDAIGLPYNEDNLMFWALDLYCKGYEFDCRLGGYGALTDPKNLTYLELENETAENFHKKGIDAINKRNFGAAIIYFTTALKLDEKKAKTWQARGYCKDEIHTWKAARKDYNKALEIDPNYVDALLLRATNKDNAGEHDEALKDYNKVIEIEPKNDLAYFNRGNTKFSLGDKKGACNDWAKAKSLGSPYAQERITAECK
jgi:tetratricopeptide (TPR) repeat protein